MLRIRSFVERRSRLMALAGALALLSRVVALAPPPPTAEGLAGILGRSVGGVVQARDIAWEPSSGLLGDATLGRRVLFLGAPRADGPRDLYRARVRLGRDGSPVVVRDLRNLSSTPLGDEAGLTTNAGYASFATVAYGGVQAVTVLTLDRGPAGGAALTPLGWLQRTLTAWQSTGSPRGLGRMDVLFDVAPAAVEIELTPPTVAIGVDGRSHGLLLDTMGSTLTERGGGQISGIHLARVAPDAKPFILWAVDTARMTFGARPVAWAEDVAFTTADLLRQAYFGLGVAGARPSAKSDSPLSPPADAALAGPADDWPPPNLPSIWDTELAGEGVWEPVEYSFLAPVVGSTSEAPPYFFRTFIRPDSKRSFSRLMLVALDMRQLDVRVQAGREDPKPLTGPSGTGRIPREGNTLDRVVATFNGAFKTDHGPYGMVVDRRVLLPPVPGAATFIVDDQGRSGFGTWPASPEIPAHVVSLRQNLEPLLVDGTINPTGRSTWGEQLVGTGVQTQRTAICMTPAGHVYYAFGSHIDATSLGRGLRQAGCSYAIHLDMNPRHCGFVFADVVDMDQHRFELRKADGEMSIAPEKFVFSSAKDFFYVLVRDLRPPSIQGAVWEPSPGRQPNPAFLTGIFRTVVRVGGVAVELTSFAPNRFDFVLRAGTREPRPLTAPPPTIKLEASDQKRALAAIGLGATTTEHQLGLSFHQLPTLGFRDDAAILAVGPSGFLRVVSTPAALKLGAGEVAIQLPLLASESSPNPRADAPGPLRERAALGTGCDGHVMVARATHDTSAVLANALLAAGCDLVVELERGAQIPPFLHRARTPDPPASQYDGSVLYALDRPTRPRTYRF
ncbi:MAG: hypothetical protein JW751_20885 [Polyangiaceae bacterium]|nr:hypothetical protein [Polyangiaceae bacterium]